jgi:hypothetical protein
MSLSFADRIAALTEKAAARRSEQRGVSPGSFYQQQPGVSPPQALTVTAATVSPSRVTPGSKALVDSFADVRAIPFWTIWPVLVEQLGIEPVRDLSYIGKTSARYRVKLHTSRGGAFVLVVNPSENGGEDQFFDETRGRGGGGAIDLLQHILPTWSVKGCAAWLRKHIR